MIGSDASESLLAGVLRGAVRVPGGGRSPERRRGRRLRGQFTRELLAGARRGRRVTAIEPEPAAGADRSRRRHPELELIERPSLEALGELARADAVIIDGDHNYYTVLRELRLIGERQGTGGCRSFCSTTSAGRTRAGTPTTNRSGSRPSTGSHLRAMRCSPRGAGVRRGGLLFPWAAEREGGPGNGVLTAVEDFMRERGPAPGRDSGILRSRRALARGCALGGKVAEIVAPLDGSRCRAAGEAQACRHPSDPPRPAGGTAALAPELASFSRGATFAAQSARRAGVLARLGEADARRLGLRSGGTPSPSSRPGGLRGWRIRRISRPSARRGAVSRQLWLAWRARSRRHR